MPPRVVGRSSLSWNEGAVNLLVDVARAPLTFSGITTIKTAPVATAPVATPLTFSGITPVATPFAFTSITTVETTPIAPAVVRLSRRSEWLFAVCFATVLLPFRTTINA